MSYIFQRLSKNAEKAGISEKDIAQSRAWFRAAALKVSRVDIPKMMSTTDPFTTFQQLSASSIGKMYLFQYANPKHKKTLPYYDVYPLVFPIDFWKGKDGTARMLGINMHYLPPVFRAKLMDALYTTASNKKYDKTTVLRISYSILKSAAKFRYFKPCVHEYILNRVTSPFMYINPKNWDKVLLLPLERFKRKNGAISKQIVWNKSIQDFV